MCVATMAGRTTPKMRKALPMGRAAHGASPGVPGVVPPGEPGRRLQEPAPGVRCSYPPAGRCWASVPGHRHVRRHQCDAAPTHIAAAICRRAVTAAGSDGPICLTSSPVAPAWQQRLCPPGLLAVFRCQPCTRRSARWAAMTSSTCAGSVPDAVARPPAMQALRLACWTMEKEQAASRAGYC